MLLETSKTDSLIPRIRPFPARAGTMASADFSRLLAERRRPVSPLLVRTKRETSQGKLQFLPSALAGFTHAPLRMKVGHLDPLLDYPECACLVSDSCSSSPTFASGFLQTPPRGDALAIG